MGGTGFFVLEGIMYSILIKNGDKNYFYLTNEDGTVFKGNAEVTKTKIRELMGSYPTGRITVVHNVTLTADFTLEDVV